MADVRVELVMNEAMVEVITIDEDDNQDLRFFWRRLRKLAIRFAEYNTANQGRLRIRSITEEPPQR